ncbi:hypothetical protein DPV73_01900 [Leptospira mayottensis]|nr:hypothetical protein DPV73_01900 [Leptospira mayottensis]
MVRPSFSENTAYISKIRIYHGLKVGIKIQLIELKQIPTAKFSVRPVSTSALSAALGTASKNSHDITRIRKPEFGSAFRFHLILRYLLISPHDLDHRTEKVYA